jgi:hypothetical protein
MYISPVYSPSFALSKLAAGQSFSMELKYYPLMLKTEGAAGYPAEYYSFMDEPLISVTGTGPLSVKDGSLDEKISAMLEDVGSVVKGNAEFSSIHDVDATTDMDSLDASEYFKQLCIENDVPCRLVIGTADNSYYAWIRAYNGQWIDVDAYGNARQLPSYDVSYLEPLADVHTMPLADDPQKMIYDGTVWIKSLGQINFLIYFIIVIVFASAGVVIFISRKMLIKKFITKGGPVWKESGTFDGKYEVLSEEIEDSFMKEIIKKIKETEGVVNTQQMSETMHFSKELIEDGISYLLDQRFLRKIM